MLRTPGQEERRRGVPGPGAPGNRLFREKTDFPVWAEREVRWEPGDR